MSAVLQASGLGKQYRRTWALRDCTLAIPDGHVTGLVGPNGAGKTTLLRLAALQVAMPLWVRPNLAPPDHAVNPVTSLGNALPSQTGPGGDTFTLYANSIPGQPGAWLLSSGPVNAAGRATSTTPAACTSVGNTGPSAGANGGASPPGQGPPAFLACLASHGIREAITYQPANRYWRFQTTETAIYLALTLTWPGTASGGSAACPEQIGATITPPGQLAPAATGPSGWLVS